MTKTNAPQFSDVARECAAYLKKRFLTCVHTLPAESVIEDVIEFTIRKAIDAPELVRLRRIAELMQTHKFGFDEYWTEQNLEDMKELDDLLAAQHKTEQEK